jgi:hypothetical protein
MTQDEIIEMAKEAGCIPRRHPEYWEDVQVFATPDVLVAFAKLVAAREREACAKMCEQLEALSQGEDDPPPYRYYEAIRARGEA